MSTDNISAEPKEGKPVVTAGSIIADLGRLGAAARSRSEELAREVKGLDTQAQNVAFGARVAEQKLTDDRVILEEEGDQLRWILKGSARDVLDDALDREPPAPIVDDTVPVPPFDDDPDWLNGLYASVDLGHMSDGQLLELAEMYGYDGEDVRRVTLIEFILEQQHIWCMDNEVDDPNVIVINVHNRGRVQTVINVRDWNWAQWVGAVIVGLIAFGVGMLTRHFPGWHGLSMGAFAFVWVTAITSLGFFLGGYVGSLVDHAGTEEE